ncbi:MAG: DNA repair protein RadC [Nanoarchaeota archaeon]|nr:DNA repair protein RadC [Nanoarchaeota archaeon]
MEMPREKLVDRGTNALTNEELLAILLRTGTKGKPVLDLSKEILEKFTPKTLNNIQQLTKIKGVSTSKASIIIAAFEIAKRFHQQNLKQEIFDSPKKVYEYLSPELKHLQEERVIALFMDSKLQLIKKETISKGSISYSIIEPRKIFEKVIETKCHGFFLIHNHPSGDPTPSGEDIKATHEIKELSKYMKVQLLDHIIIGNDYYSFFDNNKL